MIDAERQVWCAAFGASFAGFEGRERAKQAARAAVASLGGPSAHLSADSMMVAVIAERKLSREEGS